jgi:hypothetical protein
MCLPSLYDLRLVKPHEVAAIETDFQRLESDAADVYRRLCAKTASLTSREIEVWAFFLLAQMARLPRHLRRAETLAREHFEEWSRPDAEFDAKKGDLPHSTLFEYLHERAPALLANMHLRTLMSIMIRPDLAHRLCKMKWSVRWNIEVPLVLSDDPIIRSGNLLEGPCEIAMPLGPHTAFHATTDEARMEWFRDERDKWLAFALNESSVRRAAKEIVGNVARSFVEKRLAPYDSD